MALTYQQTRLVRGTIPALREHGEEITTIFYKEMLAAHPQLHNYFNSVNQANGRQPRALTAIILNFAANINHTSELIPKLERMCHKHCSLGIQPEHYEIVGKYLIRAFGDVLGASMTPEVEAAWTRAYWILAKMLIGREAQMYKDFEGWKGWRRFRIDRKVAESDDIFSFYLVPKDGRRLPSFMPGQYVSVRLDVPSMGYVQSRQYSLSERPRPDYYRITIKRDLGSHVACPGGTAVMRPGVVSNLLIDHKKPGDEVDVSHPAGEAFLDTSNTSNQPLVLISAGVGITPMMSILNAVTEQQPTRPVSFVHGSHRTMPFEAHVRALERAAHQRGGGGGGGGGLKTHVFKTRLADADLACGSGVAFDHDVRVDLARLSAADLFLDHSSAEYFICGPEQFMVEVADYLAGRGVPRERVKFELFSTGELEATAATGAAAKPVNTTNGVNGGTTTAAAAVGVAAVTSGMNGLSVNGEAKTNSHPVGYPVSRAREGSVAKIDPLRMNGRSTAHTYHNW
jgi:nitric oxide dioxygenase